MKEINQKTFEEELINVYKIAIKDNKNFLGTRSLHWENYYKKNSKFSSVENLKNFRKNLILSEGLDDAMNLQNKLNLIEVFDYFNGEYLSRTLPKKNIGNSNYSIDFLGYHFDYGIIHHLKWYEKIEKFIKPKNKILEIGGGFGSLARIILSNNNEIKYFSIDLPEANLMSNYYLQNHFQSKKIFNYLDFKNKSLEENLNKYDIFILPPNTINNKNIKFDFVINSRSFMEMNKGVINQYFDLIQKKINLGGYFLNVNKYFSQKVGEKIKLHEYPYDNRWKTIISEQSFLQEGIHFLLAERVANEGDILDELNKISQKKIKHQNEKKINLYILLKKIFYKFSKNTLIFVLGRKMLNKIAKILYGISISK